MVYSQLILSPVLCYILKITCYLFLFLAVLGLLLQAGFLQQGKQGLLSWLLDFSLPQAVASPVVEHMIQGVQFSVVGAKSGSVVVARKLQSEGLVIMAHELSCPAACGIFLDQGWNPCLPHCKVYLNYWTTREALYCYVNGHWGPV